MCASLSTLCDIESTFCVTWRCDIVVGTPGMFGRQTVQTTAHAVGRHNHRSTLVSTSTHRDSSGPVSAGRNPDQCCSMADQCAPATRHHFTHEGRVVYEWDQTLADVNLYVQVPPGTRGKQLYCDIHPTSIKLGLVPNPPYLQGELSAPVAHKESYWTLDDGVMTITLQKRDQGEPWPSVIKGHELDPATQQQDTQRLMLERFQTEHPGFDFSGATFNGQVPNPRTFMKEST